MPWNLDDDRPIYLQLMERIQHDIVSGTYQPGDKLPSVRDLAAQAQVNPNTVQRALTELEREGLLVSGGTNGRTVTQEQSVLSAMRDEELQELARECLEKFRVFGLTPEQAANLLLSFAEKKEES